MSMLRDIIAESSSSEDENDDLVQVWFRVSKNVAKWLTQRLQSWLKPPTPKNKAVSPVQQVLIALEYYACGSFQRCVGDTAGVHKSTVSRIIYRVSRAIAMIGAIDCTHVQIKSPDGPDAENYRNRKLIFSVNVQVICDAKMYITNIVARWPGSSHDSHIFNSSVIKGRLEDGDFNGYWLIGDKGYAIKPYSLTPLRNPVSDREKLYNES
ncbi:unnamed protein product, partial [Brenthis ino]